MTAQSLKVTKLEDELVHEVGTLSFLEQPRLIVVRTSPRGLQSCSKSVRQTSSSLSHCSTGVNSALSKQLLSPVPIVSFTVFRIDVHT